MMSYVTSLGFQYRYSGNFSAGGTYSQYNINYIKIPGYYRNKMAQVGPTNAKVFMADGARWWNGSGGVTTTSTLLTTSPGGEGADYGPWQGPANARSYRYSPGAGDGRGNAMRHGGNRAGNVSYAALRMNLAFFDAHVETMNGLQAADPAMWVPSGTTISTAEAPTASDPGYQAITQTYWPGGTDIVAP